MYRSRDGRWTVERVPVDAPDGAGEPALLRLYHRGYPVAECRSAEEIAALIDLADLELVDDSDDPLRPAPTRVPEQAGPLG